MSEEWRLITVKYTNKCVECSQTISEGEQGLWLRGVGIKHQVCQSQDKESEIQEIPKELHDKNVYDYHKVRNLNYCQYCGEELEKSTDLYINDDKRSCEQCFLF